MMLAAMMMAVVTANAQHDAGTITIQPKIGGIISWVSNTPSLDLGTEIKLDKSVTAGALIGAEFEYQVSNLISVAAGLNYSLQGGGWSNYSEQIGGTKIEIKDTRMELGYITLPVVANFYLFKGFAVKAGVQFGFLTNANLKSTIEVGKRKVDLDESFTSECNKVDVSIPFGVSYELSNVPVVIDMRYNLGLTKINKESEPGYKDIKNNVIQVTAGYKFTL